ncbi:MAG: S-layer homology domain-containing protein, partial [Cyanobacteriota bacterium]|nr:S-layer homology domain-containing protein [Cyanobacteriota bacterium]
VTGGGELRGVTVQNPQGIGLVMLGGDGMIRACRFRQCGVAGLQVMGEARPLLINLRVEGAVSSGIRIIDQAKGEVRNCILQRCRLGLELQGTAAPLLRGNQCSGNQTGLRLMGQVSPVLRQNRLTQNQQVGLWISDQARPDLGQPADPGENIFRHNGQLDLRNDTSLSLVAVGNDLIPQALQGNITLAASQSPDPAAVPASLLDQPPLDTSTHLSPPVVLPPLRPPSPPAVAPPRFPDLVGHWAASYVMALADRGLVKGFQDGTYHPDAVINRAQFAALVASAYGGLPVLRGPVTFVDVPANFWAYHAIDHAQRRGFIGGYPDRTYRPQQPMTRVQAMVAVVTGLKLPAAPASELSVYQDRAQIPSYAVNALARASQSDLVINYPDPAQLRPQEPITRGEVAGLIYQGLVALDQAPPLTAPVAKLSSPVQGSFADMQNHWARDAIQALLNANLVRGESDGRFYPDRAMTRAQFAALIARAFSPSPRRPALSFTDVPPSHWAAAAIQTAYRGGFLAGFPDQSFGAEGAVLRVQIWVALVHGLDWLRGQPVDLEALQRFRDRDQIPSYAQAAVARATQLQLVVNVPDQAQLNPNQVASRADIAVAVYQALVRQGRMPPLVFNHGQ